MVVRATRLCALLLSAATIAVASAGAEEGLGAHWRRGPTAGRAERAQRVQKSVAALRPAAVDGEEAGSSAPPEWEAALVEAAAEVRRAGRKGISSVAAGALSAVGKISSSTEVFWKTERCVMCEYILEVADRNIKSMPHWAHGGDGNFVGMTDFSGGIQQGAYRAYSGQYLQLEEGTGASAQSGARHELSPAVTALLDLADAVERGPSAPAGSGLPDGAAAVPDVAEPRVAQQPSHRHRGDPTRFSPRLTPAAARRAASLRALARRVHRSALTRGANPPAPTAFLENPLNDPSPMVGRRTFQDFNRVDSAAEKSTEYGQMFDDLMDQLDDVCQNDIPTSHKGGQKACKALFLNGEALTEYYLHGYEDWEICSRLDVCPDHFFDRA